MIQRYHQNGGHSVAKDNGEFMLSKDVLKAMDKIKEQLELGLFSLLGSKPSRGNILNSINRINKALELIKQIGAGQ